MDIEEYYKNVFRHDLDRIYRSGGIDKDRRLSFICLMPDKPPSLVEAWTTFQSIQKKHRFLFCFFLCAVLDQAIHSGLNEDHGEFDRIAQFPKFAGILSSYHSNLHPEKLLEIAGFYVNHEDQEHVIDEFKAIVSVFLDDTISNFNNLFNRRREELQKHAKTPKWIVVLFNTMLEAFPLIYSLGDGLQNQCVQHFRSTITQKLNIYQQMS